MPTNATEQVTTPSHSNEIIPEWKWVPPPGSPKVAVAQASASDDAEAVESLAQSQASAHSEFQDFQDCEETQDVQELEQDPNHDRPQNAWQGPTPLPESINLHKWQEVVKDYTIQNLQVLGVREDLTTKVTMVLDKILDKVEHQFRELNASTAKQSLDDGFTDGLRQAREDYHHQLEEKIREIEFAHKQDGPTLAKPTNDPQAKVSTKWTPVPKVGEPYTGTDYDGVWSTAILPEGKMAHAQLHGHPGQEQYMTITADTLKIACTTWTPYGDLHSTLAQVEHALSNYYLPEMITLQEEVTQMERWLNLTKHILPEDMEEMPPLYSQILFQINAGDGYEAPPAHASQSRHPWTLPAQRWMATCTPEPEPEVHLAHQQLWEGLKQITSFTEKMQQYAELQGEIHKVTEKISIELTAQLWKSRIDVPAIRRDEAWKYLPPLVYPDLWHFTNVDGRVCLIWFPRGREHRSHIIVKKTSAPSSHTTNWRGAITVCCYSSQPV